MASVPALYLGATGFPLTHENITAPRLALQAGFLPSATSGTNIICMIHWLTDEATLREMSDKDLLAAFQRTDGESAEAENLLREIERRELDF